MALRCVEGKQDGDVTNSRNKIGPMESGWELSISYKYFVRSAQDSIHYSIGRERDHMSRIAKIARIGFAFVAISTSCEGLFSVARNTLAYSLIVFIP
jgi:hypothetical protein